MNKLIAISTLVLGFGLGAWWAHQSGSPETSESSAVASTPTLMEREPSMSAGRADIDLSVLRALIKEEMTAVLAGKLGNNPAAPAPVQGPVSPETLAQRREAQEQIDTLIAQGVWGNEQRLNFQQKVAMLDPEQRERALQALTSGINNGSVQVSTDGPPL
jgi:hypothetical protein